jgi:hypothetical protein
LRIVGYNARKFLAEILKKPTKAALLVCGS